MIKQTNARAQTAVEVVTSDYQIVLIFIFNDIYLALVDLETEKVVNLASLMDKEKEKKIHPRKAENVVARLADQTVDEPTLLSSVSNE